MERRPPFGARKSRRSGIALRRLTTRYVNVDTPAAPDNTDKQTGTQTNTQEPVARSVIVEEPPEEEPLIALQQNEQQTEVIWSTTMTVGTTLSGTEMSGTRYTGYNTLVDPPAGSVDGTTYTVQVLARGKSTFGGNVIFDAFTFAVDREPDELPADQGLVLYVGDHRLSFEDLSGHSGDDHQAITWNSNLPTLTDGDTVDVRLEAPAARIETLWSASMTVGDWVGPDLCHYGYSVFPSPDEGGFDLYEDEGSFEFRGVSYTVAHLATTVFNYNRRGCTHPGQFKVFRFMFGWGPAPPPENPDMTLYVGDESFALNDAYSTAVSHEGLNYRTYIFQGGSGPGRRVPIPDLVEGQTVPVRLEGPVRVSL